MPPVASLSFSCALLLTPATALFAQPASLPPKERFHLFVLAGQSNMAGRGAVTAADQVAHPRVLMLNNTGEWVPAVDPVHFDKPELAGVGLGRSFGLEIAKAAPDATIGLIPCAVGGSPIDVWKPGAYYDATQSHPWDDALRRIRQALDAGTLKGILWHQGESDSSSALAPSYEAKLHDLIARFREKLSAPAVPFVVGQMGMFAENPWDDPKRQVDRAHRELPQKVKHCAFVSAGGLRHNGDNLHFDAESYREFGRRFATTYLDLIRRPTGGRSK